MSSFNGRRANPLSPEARQRDDWVAKTAEQGSRRSLLIGALILLLIAGFDFETGKEVWLGPMYLLLVCSMSWTLGFRVGLLTLAACALASVAANGPSLYPYDTAPDVWNFAARIGLAVIAATGVAHLRTSLLRERRYARTDPTTGLLNRFGFFEKANKQRRGDGWGLLIYMDLDGFKQINDHLGHAAGDEALKDFARGLRKHIREEDVCGRIGGDEFLLHLMLPSREDALTLAQLLHLRLNQLSTSKATRLKCSMGGVVFAPGMSALSDGDLQLADKVMYEAKRLAAGVRLHVNGGTIGGTQMGVHHSTERTRAVLHASAQQVA